MFPVAGLHGRKGNRIILRFRQTSNPAVTPSRNPERTDTQAGFSDDAPRGTVRLIPGYALGTAPRAVVGAMGGNPVRLDAFPARYAVARCGRSGSRLTARLSIGTIGLLMGIVSGERARPPCGAIRGVRGCESH